MDTPLGKSTVGEMLPYFIIIAILLMVVILSFKMIIATSKIRKENKQKRQNLKEEGLSIRTLLNHVNGLPIAENLPCEIFSFPNRLEFKAGTTQIKLDRSKITDMCVKTDVEIQNQVVSSIGGAIAGGVVFGPLGAIIGGRAKNKKTKTTNEYLIITYTGDQGELKYIGFDTKLNPFAASSLVREFHKLNTTQGIQIEL